MASSFFLAGIVLIGGVSEYVPGISLDTFHKELSHFHLPASDSLCRPFPEHFRQHVEAASFLLNGTLYRCGGRYM